jgi:hypothetical protein
MAKILQYDDVTKAAQQNALTPVMGGSSLFDIYSGTMPSTLATALTGSNVKLATLTGNATFAATTSTGTLTLNALVDGTGTTEAATGTVATFFRAKTAGGVLRMQGNVGMTSDFTMMLNNTNIASGQTVSVSPFTLVNGQ